ncbi:MAG: ABC transporter ATP-binding protein [Verrucomicrobiia bacterium]|jgi:putative ABC transport system ATP-binding protein
MNSAPILQTTKLTKTYASGSSRLVVLNEVDMALDEGATCAIVGPSGSGKTTLLGLCAGLDTPTSGSVNLNGSNLSTLNEDERARLRNECVGFVFQSFQLIPTLTALENVMVPLELRGEGRAREYALELLERVGLSDRATHYPTQLSGGEQQRVALARAFINRPRILFADEPTGNLDAETSRRIVEILFELNTSLKTAIVLVTHDVELAEKAQNVIRLKAGRVVQAGE